MPAIHPHHPTSPTPRRAGTRIPTATGLSIAALAVALALPTAASAEPDAEDKLDTVTTDLKKAEKRLSDLTDERDEITDGYEDAQRVIDDSPHSVRDVLSKVDPSGSPMERLSALNGYGNSHTGELATAVETRADAEARLPELDDDIDKTKSEVSDLKDERDKLRDKIAEASDSAAEGDSDSPKVSADASGAIKFAKQQLGDPYVFGSTGPDSWDCSSLTQASWAAAGKEIGRDTYAQWDNMRHISRDELRPGDLVFYNSQGHVALYLGDGKVIHAPTEGDVVRYADVDMMPIDGYTRA